MAPNKPNQTTPCPTQSPNKPNSPYKAMQNANMTWAGRVSLSLLTPNKAFKIVAINDTDHPTYGPGKLMTIVQGGGGVPKKWNTQIPKKYLSTLSEEKIHQLLHDISKKRYPFVIYRETMLDKSFRIDILHYTPELNTLWKTEGDIPEIETPVVQDSEPEEDDDELEESESSLVSQNQNNSTQTKVIDKNIGSHKRPLEEELQNEDNFKKQHTKAD